MRIAALCVAVLTAGLAGGFILHHSLLREASAGVASFEPGALPQRNLTPGVIRAVAINEVCSMPHEDVVRQVSASIRQEVFEEYGIVNARPNDYEIDYLITPGLGGAEDIHNLWPQPFKSSTWNAYVKDALEERLHQLVCSGNLDLATAQHDISSDWIAAYKKYFHTDVPLPLHSVRDTATASGFTELTSSLDFPNCNYEPMRSATANPAPTVPPSCHRVFFDDEAVMRQIRSWPGYT